MQMLAPLLYKPSLLSPCPGHHFCLGQQPCPQRIEETRASSKHLNFTLKAGGKTDKNQQQHQQEK